MVQPTQKTVQDLVDMGVRMAHNRIRSGVMRDRVLKALGQLSELVQRAPVDLTIQELWVASFLADISERTHNKHWWQLRKDISEVREKMKHYLPKL